MTAALAMALSVVSSAQPFSPSTQFEEVAGLLIPARGTPRGALLEYWPSLAPIQTVHGADKDYHSQTIVLLYGRVRLDEFSVALRNDEVVLVRYSPMRPPPPRSRGLFLALERELRVRLGAPGVTQDCRSVWVRGGLTVTHDELGVSFEWAVSTELAGRPQLRCPVRELPDRDAWLNTDASWTGALPPTVSRSPEFQRSYEACLASAKEQLCQGLRLRNLDVFFELSGANPVEVFGDGLTAAQRQTAKDCLGALFKGLPEAQLRLLPHAMWHRDRVRCAP